jgi:hypothetical protein
MLASSTLRHRYGDRPDIGRPVWHASVWPPSRTRAEAVLSGVGEGALFEEPEVHSQILHLRRRMTMEEIKPLGGTG